MKHFGNIAQLVKDSRQNHPKGYSQSELSYAMGYKNGQFISNIERGLCSTPLKSLYRLSHVLQIDKEVLKKAIIEDMAKTLDYHLEKEMTEDRVESTSKTVLLEA